MVIVTPSVYGTDNSATIYGMKARGKDARGVAVIDDKTTDAELSDSRRSASRASASICRPPASATRRSAERFLAAAERVKSRNWHVQLNTTLPVIAAMKDALAASPVPIVFDHYGGAKEELASRSPASPIWSSLVNPARPMSRSRSPPGRARTTATSCRSPSADRRQCRPHPLGYQLAASEFGGGQHRRRCRRCGRSTTAWC